MLSIVIVNCFVEGNSFFSKEFTFVVPINHFLGASKYSENHT